MSPTLWGSIQGWVIGLLLPFICCMCVLLLELLRGAGVSVLAWIFRSEISVLSFLKSPWRFFTPHCREPLYASFADMQLVYIANCSVNMMLMAVRFVTATQSSTVAYTMLVKASCMPTRFLSPLVYPTWQDICCILLRSDCASTKWAWIFPDIVCLFPSPPGAAFFLKLAGLRNEAICDLGELTLSDRLARHGCVVWKLIETHVEEI